MVYPTQVKSEAILKQEHSKVPRGLWRNPDALQQGLRLGVCDPGQSHLELSFLLLHVSLQKVDASEKVNSRAKCMPLDETESGKCMAAETRQKP